MTRSNRFYIHSLQIVQINVMGARKNLDVYQHSQDMEDIISLNEYICYEEDEIRCEELADISDYGDDDQEVPSELSSPISSSEIGEEMEEEGEQGFANMADIESSSSHEDIIRKTTRRSESKHGDKKTLKKKKKIPEDLENTYYDFEGGKTSDDERRKKTKLKKKDNFENDQPDDNGPGPLDEPKAKSKKRRSSKMRTATDTDDKKDKVHKSDEFVDNEVRHDTSHGKKKKNKQSKIDKDSRDKSKELSGKEPSRGEMNLRKNILEKQGYGENVNDTEKGKVSNTEKGKDTIKQRKDQDSMERGTDDNKNRSRVGDKEQGKADSKESGKQLTDTKREKQDSQVKLKGGKPEIEKQAEQAEQEGGRKAETERFKPTENAKMKEWEREKSKKSEQTKDRQPVEKSERKLQEEKNKSQLDDAKKKLNENDYFDGIDSRDISKSTMNLTEKDQETSRSKLPVKKVESKLENIGGKKSNEVKKRDENGKESKMKMDEQDETKKLGTDKRDSIIERMDRIIMDETVETRDSIQMKKTKDHRPIRQYLEQKTKRGEQSIEKSKTEADRKLLIQKSEFGEMEKQYEKTNRLEKQTKKDLEKEEHIKHEPNLEQKNQYSSDQESFRASYGELFVAKTDQVTYYDGLTALLERADVEIKQETQYEAPKKGKGKRSKGKKKKLKTVKKDTLDICNFDLSEFAIEGCKRKTKICQNETANDICCNVLNKLECKKKASEVCMNEETLEYSMSRDGKYPGFNQCPINLVTIQSSSSSYNNLLRLLRSAFQCTDRVLVQTTWNNFVVFRYCHGCQKAYYLYTGCTCNINRFRHMDLRNGTAGLMEFSTIHDIITTIKFYRKPKKNQKIKEQKTTREEKVKEILKQYASP